MTPPPKGSAWPLFHSFFFDRFPYRITNKEMENASKELSPQLEDELADVIDLVELRLKNLPPWPSQAPQPLLVYNAVGEPDHPWPNCFFHIVLRFLLSCQTKNCQYVMSLAFVLFNYTMLQWMFRLLFMFMSHSVIDIIFISKEYVIKITWCLREW